MKINSRTGSVLGAGVAFGTLAAAAFAGRSKKHFPDSAPGRTQRRSFGTFDVVGRSVTIDRPRSELFAFWRDFQNLPAFMENLERVVPAGSGGRTIWTIKAPAGRTTDIESEIVSEEKDHLIAWRSARGSDVETEGRVTFEDAPGSRGTRVSLTIAYKPPAGGLGKAVAKLSMRDPETQARHDLKRFKMLMETGEIATSAHRRDQTRAAKQAENS